jgi:hypothetical protein
MRAVAGPAVSSLGACTTPTLESYRGATGAPTRAGILQPLTVAVIGERPISGDQIGISCRLDKGSISVCLESSRALFERLCPVHASVIHYKVALTALRTPYRWPQGNPLIRRQIDLPMRAMDCLKRQRNGLSATTWAAQHGPSLLVVCYDQVHGIGRNTM